MNGWDYYGGIETAYRGPAGRGVLLFRLGLFAILLLPVALFLLTGCLPNSDLLKETEEEKEKAPPIKTLGDITSFGNLEAITVSGVGLVERLDGTGGDPPPAFREMIEPQLRLKGEEHIKELLASPTTSIVLVSARIPAGVRKGDPLDVEVSLPPNSRTTSLRGGYLRECTLFERESVRSIAPNLNIDGTAVGHGLATARGPLQVGLGDGDVSAKVKRGRIWGGGKSKIDRPFYLVLNNEQQLARIAQEVARRVNETFHGPSHGVAEAKNSLYVLLGVPEKYRLNLQRYMRVVRMIPLREEPEGRLKYRKKLDEDLNEPSRTLAAALRLEALGDESILYLKKGLNSDHVLVRFAAAEALAYLGQASGAEELARLAEKQLYLRAYCLTALASLDQAISHIKLRELLASNRPETRYGAFWALRNLDPNDDAVRGEMLNESFWLHRVAPNAPPLVHVSGSRRAEVVLFGEDTYLVPPFSILAGPEFTVTAGKDDDHCIIGRFSPSQGSRRKPCSLRLDDVLRTMADLGAQYPDAIELLRKADQSRSLSGMMAIDALPQAVSVYELAKAGAGGPDLAGVDAEILTAREGFGATPTLFEKTADRRKAAEAGEESEDKEKDEKPKPERRQGVYHPKPTWGAR
jgi:hypothetical protein